MNSRCENRNRRGENRNSQILFLNQKPFFFSKHVNEFIRSHKIKFTGSQVIPTAFSMVFQRFPSQVFNLYCTIEITFDLLPEGLEDKKKVGSTGQDVINIQASSPTFRKVPGKCCPIFQIIPLEYLFYWIFAPSIVQPLCLFCYKENTKKKTKPPPCDSRRKIGFRKEK